MILTHEAPAPVEADQELLLLSAQALAGLIRRREVSPVQVVRAHIRRIQQVNPAINAMVEDRFEQAMEEARAVEASLGRGEVPGPLAGVPFTVKEAIALQGAPLTSGSIYRKGMRATEDSTAVNRLRAAGAIPLGVTNISEMCMWMESDNVLYGRTGNPYDPNRTCGGSSGGEGAIIGAGGSPFGVGADIGGSIRMPAFFCGIFGHKPTGGLVPMTGHYPGPRAGAGRICTTGPLCRRAEDLMPLLRLMAGPDGRDPLALDVQLEKPGEVSFKSKPVLVCESLGGLTSRVHPELRQAVHFAGRVFEGLSARVEPWSHPGTGRAALIWAATLQTAGEPPFHQIMGEGQSPPLLREWLAVALGRGRHTVPALGLATLEKALDLVRQGDLQRLVNEGHKMREEIEDRLAGGGLLVLPTHPRLAPQHGRPMLRPLDWSYTALFNAMELPVTATPMGLSTEGLPLGVQLVAPRLQDHRTIAGAQVLERASGGWVMPR